MRTSGTRQLDLATQNVASISMHRPRAAIDSITVYWANDNRVRFERERRHCTGRRRRYYEAQRVASMRRLIRRGITFMSFALVTNLAVAQCAPGIPSAGNPACIPPNQTNSPYYQGGTDQLPPPPPIGHWENRWGAVSLDYSAMKAGFLTGEPSKSEAEKSATQKCLAAGGSDCEIVITFRNQCASIAQDQTTHLLSTATAATAEDASRRSLKRCDGNCKEIYNQCSYPELVN